MPRRSPTARDIEAIINAIKPFFIRPWFGVIAVMLTAAGLTAIAPGTFSFLPFFWCYYSHRDRPSSVIYELCQPPDEVLSNSYLSIGVGFVLILMAAWIIWINLKVKKVERGWTITIPKQGMTFKQAVELVAVKKNKNVKLKGLSELEFKALTIDGTKGPIGYEATGVELIYACIARLKTHKFSSLQIEEEDRELLIVATPHATVVTDP